MNSDLIAHTHHFRAMGSQMQLWLDCTDADVADRAFVKVVEHFAQAEALLSRFQSQSELSQLNQRPGQWTVVSPLLWAVLSEALTLADLTGGMYDPTLLAALQAAGYIVSFDDFPSAPGAASTVAPVLGGGWRQIELDHERRAVWLPPGARLDFGGIAKGYVAAQAADMLSAWGPCLVDAGGDVVAGAAPGDWPGWPVAIAAPGRGDAADLMSVWLVDAALATSGIDYRRWQHNGRPAHHIVDPRTGRPAETDLQSVSVLLRHAAQAEAVATAALVLGAEAGWAWLAEQNIPALLADQTGAIRPTPAMEAAYADF